MTINNTPFDNTQPSLVLTQAIDTTGNFPSRDGGASGDEALALIRTFAFDFHPGGTATAGGQLLPIAQNQVLYSVIGTAYGGDGYTTFALPDLAGRVSVDSVYSGYGYVGLADGQAATTINRGEIPTSGDYTGQPVPNVQPELSTTYAIRVNGSFPSGAQDGTIGGIVEFAGSYTPNSGGEYLPCDGRLLAIKDYTALYSLLGTYYGGNGTTSFALPDLRGRDIVGVGQASSGTNYVLGETGGLSNVYLTNGNLPVAVGGGSQPFLNEQPFLAMTYAIATVGIYPQRDGSAAPNGAPYIGEVRAFAEPAGRLPAGWVAANGQTLAIQSNPELFSLIGNTYGGDGQTTFELPDLRGRTIMESGLRNSDHVSFQLGQVLGSETVTLTADQTPNFKAPVNTVPGPVTADTTGHVTFSAASNTKLSVQDGDNASLSVTVHVDHGTLTASTSGVTGNGTATLTLSGATGDINTALNGLVYQVTAGYAGSDTLRLTTTDSQLTDTDTVTITTLNHAPVNTVPSARTVAEDTNLIFSTANANAISVSDVDFGPGNATVTLSVAHGALTLASIAGLVFSAGDGTADSSMTFTGTLSEVNNALNGLTYRGSQDFNGADTLTVTTSDNGNTGAGGAKQDQDTIAITVTAVNDAPTAPVDTDAGTANAVAERAAAGTYVGVTAHATDVDAGDTVTYSLTNSAGGFFGIDAQTGRVTTTAVGAAGIDYESGTHSYAITVAASDGQATATSNFTIAVLDANDTAPTITTAAGQSAAENTTFVANLTSSDPDSVGTNPAAFTITGGADAAKFAIATIGGVQQLQFIAPPDYETGPHSYQVQVTASDGVNGTAKLITVAVTDVDDTAPTVTGLTTASPSPTDATSLTYTLAFSEAVTGVDASDFALHDANGNAVAGTIGTPATSDGGHTYSVTASGLTGNGPVHLDLNGTGTGIADVAGNPLSGGATGTTILLQHDDPTKLTLHVAEDAYGGNAQFVVLVDGQQVGSPYTVTQAHDGSHYQSVAIDGDFSNAHTVAVQFTNDAYGGDSAHDRNLYVDSITLNGHTYQGEDAVNTAGPNLAGDAAALMNGGGQLTFGTDQLTLHVSQDAYQGSAQFIVLADGQQVGGVHTVSSDVSHGANQYGDVAIAGDFSGHHSIAVQFVNDLYGGDSAHDRNLYVDSITLNGHTYQGEDAVNTAGPNLPTEAALLNGGGQLTFGLDQLTLRVAEDAYGGDAQFVVLVDGHQVGGTQTVSPGASYATEHQDIVVNGDFSNAHSVAVQFTNDAYGGDASTDRNLYVDSLTVNGHTYEGEDAVNGAGPNLAHEAALYNGGGQLTFDLLHA